MKQHRGMGMLEIMIGLIIVAFILAWGSSMFSGMINRTKINKVESNITTIQKTLDETVPMFAGSCPDIENDEVAALCAKKIFQGVTVWDIYNKVGNDDITDGVTAKRISNTSFEINIDLKVLVENNAGLIDWIQKKYGGTTMTITIDTANKTYTISYH